MRRVTIIGSGGAGKSTLARELGDITGLPVIHLDREFWRPGWTETPKADWKERVDELAKGDEWIIDGNFGGTMEIRLASADTAVFLDFPRMICTYRAIKRAVTYRNRTRPDMGSGCNEKFDLEFLRWIWQFPDKTVPTIEARLAKLRPNVKLIRLHSPKEVESFLSEVRSRFAKA
jgi:adenylate kinase family enzyme